MNVEQLNQIIKLYYFYTLKALWDGQGKIKMYYGKSRIKKQLSGKRSILSTSNKEKIIKTPFSSVSIVGFEELNVCWEDCCKVDYRQNARGHVTTSPTLQ